MKHALKTIAGAILLLLSVNTVTLAQDAGKKEGHFVDGMFFKIPSEPMDLRDKKTGRIIHGSILSRNEKGPQPSHRKA